jgi:AcrR family transcriptional regulator
VEKSINLSDKRFEVLGHSYCLPLSEERIPTKERILLEASILFAIKGYASVSIRDIADKVGITPGALYNHFGGKDALLDAVLNQAKELYLIYYKHLDECLNYVTNFDELLDILFLEPIQMRNEYTNYVFSLVITEQLHNKKAGEIYIHDFIGYGISFLQNWFDLSVERGWAKPFDTKATAEIIINCVLATITMMIQRDTGNESPHNSVGTLSELKEYLRSAVNHTKMDSGAIPE